jgi:hypothetical protein
MLFVKIAYHCFSCNENFTDVKAAEGHSKSLRGGRIMRG